MKKLLALLLAGLMILSFVACGTNDTPDPSKDNPGTSQSGENNNDGEELKEVTVDNWAEVAKNDYGLDLTDLALPDGWTCNKVTYQETLGELVFIVYFEMDYTHESLTEDTEAYAFASEIFDELKSVATGDIKTSYGSGYKNFSEVELVADTIPTMRVPIGDVSLNIHLKVSETQFSISF